MEDKIVVCIKKGADRAAAEALAQRLSVPIVEENGEYLTVLFDSKGVSLMGYGLSYQGDFEGMLRRVSGGRLAHEMLARAIKPSAKSNMIKNESSSIKSNVNANSWNMKAIDATAGMGEDAFLIAAYGYEVTLYEQNPVIAALLKDALQRAKKNPDLKEIVSRMQLIEGDSIELLANRAESVDVIYLDPMFPARQKSGLINKKLQLIQKLEPPCSLEEDLFAAALAAKPSKIVVKRPLKSPHLAGRKPNYMLNGKAIRYDCYVG